WRAVLATGTVADRDWTRGAAALGGRVRVEALADCSRLYACARATLQMGGYNASYEALAAGLRPVIVPRRRPRREQELRAARLTAFGLADAVADDADVSSLVDLLERPRTVDAAAVAEAGFDLDGAARVAARLGHLARAVCAA